MTEHEKGGFLIRSWRHLERPIQILVYLLIALSAVMLFHQSEYLVIHLFNVFLLFVFAAIIALLLTPVIDRMEQVALFKGRRVFAVVLAVVVLIGGGRRVDRARHPVPDRPGQATSGAGIQSPCLDQLPAELDR